MRPIRLLLPVARARRPAVFLLCALAIFALGREVSAQSGRRRSNEGKSPTTSLPSIESESPSPTPTPKPQPPRTPLLVGYDRLGQSVNIPLYLYDAVVDGFMQRLSDSSDVKITSENNMTRKRAVDRAKADNKTFVVLLALESEYLGSMGDTNPNNLLVTYIIFTPGTGKVMSQGRVYQRYGRSILGPTIPATSPAEYRLQQAGREAAERVLNDLRVPLPADHL